jgi:hypothetical protein
MINAMFFLKKKKDFRNKVRLETKKSNLDFLLIPYQSKTR